MPVPFVHPDNNYIHGWKEEIQYAFRNADRFPREFVFRHISHVWFNPDREFPTRKYNRSVRQITLVKSNGTTEMWDSNEWAREPKWRMNGPITTLDDFPIELFDENEYVGYETAEAVAKKWLEDNFCRVTPGWETTLTGMS